MTAPRRLGRYELVARIGEGGMAEVFLARQRGPRKFEKLVVVKTVHPKLASKPALAEQLLDEARIAALVKHPNVVDIYDLGEEKGTYFIAMEYLEGESLAAVLMASRSGPRLDPFSTARIIADSAAGLHAAHELRDLKGDPLELVHQDVTPGNVIVLYGGQVKLVDFGVAKVSTSQDVALVKGKAGYLAPELFDGAPADRRSDVWALGVVLWEALTLRRLFGARTEEETFQRIRTLPIEPPSRQALAVTRDLDEVCLRALARDPAARYQTARAMHDDLLAVLRGANWSADSEPIARFMRTAFASQIAARRELLRGLAAREEPRPEVIERMSAPGDDGALGTPTGDDVVAGAHGAVRLPTAPGAPAPGVAAPGVDPGEVVEELGESELEIIEPSRSRRRRAAVLSVAAAAVALAVFAIASRGERGERVGLAAGHASGPSASGPSASGSAAASAAPANDAAAIAEASEDVDAGVIAEANVHVDAGAPVPAPDGPDDTVASRDPRRDRVGARSPERERDRGSSPTSARALYKDGLGKFVAGDTGGAIGRFQAAIARDPRYAPAHRGLGMAYERKGERSRAARSFRTYLDLAPGADDAAQIRARLARL